MKNMCLHCGLPRGAHQVVSYACPSSSGFGPLRFKLQLIRYADDEHAQAALAGASVLALEKEIARRALKNVEDALGLFDLRSPQWSTAEILAALKVVREGYEI